MQDLPVLSLFLLFVLIYPACQSLEEETPLLMTVDHMQYVSEGSYKVKGTLVSLGDKEINAYGYAWFRRVDYNRIDIHRDFSGVYRGHSVRCVKDQ